MASVTNTDGEYTSGPSYTTSLSPRPPLKRKRGKYTIKACVQCRRRKLKCSGEEPCQRCLHHRFDCCFSEAQTSVEILPRSENGLYNGTNGTRNGHAESITSDLAAEEGQRGPSLEPHSLTTEARFQRIESMLETLISMRGPEVSTRASVDPEQAEGFQGDTAFHAPIETFNANLAPMKIHLGLQHPGQATRPAHSHSGKNYPFSIPSPSGSANESISSIRVGNRTLAFPLPSDYAKYIDYFFDDVNTCHSCINEHDFRRRSEKLLSSHSVDIGDICFLALNYIMFACGDILPAMTQATGQKRLPGWQWFLTADELVGKRKMGGQGDLTLIQFLIFESLYLTYADKPNAAYNVVGLACRLCFQLGLHQQSTWGPRCNPFTTLMRQRVLWTVYFVDRRVSLSCGRPYGMRSHDIDIDDPAFIDDKELYPDRPLPAPNPEKSHAVFVSCMNVFAKFAGEIWDQVFSASASKNVDNRETLVVLDARIKHWYENIFPSFPLVPASNPTNLHHRFLVTVQTRFCHLRLLLYRRHLVSLTYDESIGRHCGDLAIDIIEKISTCKHEIAGPSSFRFHMTFSLGSAILVLATLLCRPLTTTGLQDKQALYAEHFQQGMAMLRDLSLNLEAARRAIDDLEDIVQVVEMVLSQSPMMVQEDMMNIIPENIDHLFPYSAVDFAQQSRPISENIGENGAWVNGDGAYSQGLPNLIDWWDEELQPPINGYGAPWI